MRLIILVFLFALAGCAQQRAQKQFNELAGPCRAIHMEKGHMLEREECFVDARERSGLSNLSAGGYVMDREVLRLGAEVDAGRMTVQDAQANAARIAYQINRDEAADRAQKAATAAIILGTMPQYHPYALPTPIPYTAPRNFNCTTLGAFTNCSGY
jgi:hypothetical protein